LRVVSNDNFFKEFDIDVAAVLAARAGSARVASAAQQRLELATDILLDNVSINPVRGSRLVDVKFTSPSPKLSAQVADLWVSQFQQAALDRRFLSTADAREFLEGRLAELRGRLEDAQRQLVAYAADKQIITLANGQDESGRTDTAETLVSNDLKVLNGALADATRARITAESTVRQTSSASEGSLNNQALNLMRDRRAQYASELASSLAVFEPEYPQVQALQSQLSELDRNIAREEARVRQAAQTTYQEALARENSLNREVAALKRRMLDERRDSIQYAIYQREVDTTRELYQGLLQRYKEIGVAGVGANNVTVVDRAVVPLEPSSPNLPLNLALGIIAALGLGAAYVFTREQLDQSLSDPSHVSERLGLPLLGTIPHEHDRDIQEDFKDPKSTISEAYLAATSNLTFLTSSGAPRSLIITSTRASEGKSTTAYGLALSFARIGKRTLLIDSDLRNPSQHAFFGLPKEDGLTNLLTAEAPGNLDRYVRSTDRERLFFMSAGPLPPDPGGLLNSERMRQLIQELAGKFDQVIVDGPPVLGLADAPLLSKAGDGVVYVVESGGVKVRGVLAGVRRMEFADARMCGVILTKLEASHLAYGYGEVYGYEYGTKDKK